MQAKMASMETLLSGGLASASQLVGPPAVQFASVSTPAEIKVQDHVANPSNPPTHLSPLYSALSRPKMSVSLTPSSNLGFKRPLTQLVKRSLTITNNNAQPIAFKVKTTAPKLYCVRPNSGRVEPGGSQEVSVMLQALKEEPPLNAKCKDKFLIQSTIITPDKEAMTLQEIWAATDSNEDGKVHQQKLRVSYLPAEGQTLEEEDETAHNMTSIISDAQPFDTVAQHPKTNGAAPIPSAFTASAPQPEDEALHRPATPPGDASFQESHEAPLVAQEPSQEIPVVREPSHREPSPAPPSVPAPEPTPAPVVQSRPPPVVHVSAPPPEEPKPVTRTPEKVSAPQVPVPTITVTQVNQQILSENKLLKAEVERLKNELAVKFTQPPPPPPVSDNIRRRRRSDVSESDVQTVVEDVRSHHHHQQDGVPLNLVVAISFAVFFMTYIFF